MTTFEIVHYFHDRPETVEVREYIDEDDAVEFESWELTAESGDGDEAEFKVTNTDLGVEISCGPCSRIIRPHTPEEVSS